MKQEALTSAFFICVLILGGGMTSEGQSGSQKQDWSPSKDFASRLRDKYTTMASSTDSEIYAAVYKHLLETKPGQVKDIFVCLFKYYTYSSAYSRPKDTQSSTMIRLLANMNSPLVNADDSTRLTVCNVDEDFSEAFERAFDADIEEVLAGKHLPNIVSRMLEMGTNTYFYRPYLALFKLLKVMKAVIDPSIRLPNIEPPSGSLVPPKTRKLRDHPWSGLVESNYLKKHYAHESLVDLYLTPIQTKDGLKSILLGHLMDFYEGFKWSTEDGAIPGVEEYSLQEKTEANQPKNLQGDIFSPDNATELSGKDILELSRYIQYFADVLPSSQSLLQ